MKTERLTAADVERAAEILRRGGPAGHPHETVYGLGANGLDEEAVARIFAAKGRPQDNPLILHIPSADWLERYCEAVPAAYTLAERFWPGPLTMILARKPAVPDAVTAGLDTVGMRCPAHPCAGPSSPPPGCRWRPPSGNTSGRPSPTSMADMLEDMEGKIDGIVDGGPCAVGVESTILDLTEQPPRLLRPGGVTLEELRAVLGEVAVDPAVTRLMGAGGAPPGPGSEVPPLRPQGPRHRGEGGSAAATAAYIQARLKAGEGVVCFDEFAGLYAGHQVERLGPADDKAAQARNVFDALRAFDGTGVTAIWSQCPDEAGLGLAVSNRLGKAAGFHIIDLTGSRRRSGENGV